MKTIEEKTAWSTAMAKAEGVKVKDDVDLLKKSIKKIDQRKRSPSKSGRTGKKVLKNGKTLSRKSGPKTFPSENRTKRITK